MLTRRGFRFGVGGEEHQRGSRRQKDFPRCDYVSPHPPSSSGRPTTSEEIDRERGEQTMAVAVDGARKNGKPMIDIGDDGLTISGKQWHERKTAFRPCAGLSSWSQRLEVRKAEKAVKTKEREMKAEKEEERQVCWHQRPGDRSTRLIVNICSETHQNHQRSQSRQGGEGTIREDGREDAPQESGPAEAEGEEEQAAEFMI